MMKFTERTRGRKVRREKLLGVLLFGLVFAPALAGGQRVTVPSASAFPDLITGLKQTPGCLGVEAARTMSGKQVIFAWFEDKKAALKWYYSDTHVKSMKLSGAAPSANPMANVPDDGQPILAIASLTMPAGAPQEGAMTVTQISIELYRPLPGGLAFGGRFAPSTLKVPGMREVPASAPSSTR